MNNDFTIGIIEAGINLIEELEIDTERTVKDIIRVKKETNTLTEDYKNAESLILDYGETLFKDDGKFQKLEKSILFNMISTLSPPWKSSLRHGRELFFSYIKELEEGGNIYQVFLHAGLNDSSEETISWWKLIANLSNTANEDRKEMLGLEGEILTIKYEKDKLDELNIDQKLYKIDHIASYDNSAGFDVLSWRKNSNDEIYEIQIESKMSAREVSDFHLTRNEFDKSLSNQDTFCVYLWKKENIYGDTPLKYDAKWLEKNTPKDQGTSYWSEVTITPNDDGIPDWQE